MDLTDIINSDTVALIAASIAAFAVVIVFIRVNGLRSLSKMSSFDFAMTVATSTIVASMATRSIELRTGVVSMASLFIVQSFISLLRKRFGFSRVVDNTPIMLMDSNGYNEKSLKQASVTKEDIAAKLRQANVHSLDEVDAVIMESTGDISVLHGADRVEDSVLLGVDSSSR